MKLEIRRQYCNNGWCICQRNNWKQ